MDFQRRVKELNVLPKQIKECNGLFYNPKQCRVEFRWHGALACWFTLEALYRLSKEPGDRIKQIIVDSPKPKDILLADFFLMGV